MPVGMGSVSPAAITVSLDDWARSVGKWADLIGARPTIVPGNDDTPEVARFSSKGVANLDLLPAGGQRGRGDCTLTLVPNDFDARLAAVKEAGIPVTVNPDSGDARIDARYVSGIEIVYTKSRPESAGTELDGLPYVFDVTVKDLRESVPIWRAILGDDGVETPIETDSARQFRMHHFLVDGETHAIGLMELDRDQFIKRDSLGSSQEFILDTRGEGLLCIGFLYKDDLDARIGQIPQSSRDRLQFENPRSYLMGRNNMVHADECGGVSVIIAQHFEGWKGDLGSVDELADAGRAGVK